MTRPGSSGGGSSHAPTSAPVRSIRSPITSRASASRPLRTRNSGDSGTDRRIQNTSSAGITMIPSISRQLCSGSIADDASPHSVAPTGHHMSSAVSTRPRTFRGVNSATIA